MSDTSYLASNIEYLMNVHGLNANSLQEKSGIIQSTTSRILNGTTRNPRDAVLMQYVDFFGVSLSDLRYRNLKENHISINNGISVGGNNINHGTQIGQQHSYDNATTVPINRIKVAPLINSIQAGVFTNIGDDTYGEYLPYFGDYGNDSVYWLQIDGDSMLPDFKRGEYVLINKDRQPTAGNYVAAIKENEDKATFKKYRPKGFDDNGKEYWQLIPSNEEYPIIDSRYQPFVVIGVAVERNQRLV